MQIRDRESSDETWPRKTPGAPKRRPLLDPRIKAVIESSRAVQPFPEERIEELGEPVNDARN